MNLALYLLGFLPVTPDALNLHILQAPSIHFFRPGTWLRRLLIWLGLSRRAKHTFMLLNH